MFGWFKKNKEPEWVFIGTLSRFITDTSYVYKGYVSKTDLHKRKIEKVSGNSYVPSDFISWESGNTPPQWYIDNVSFEGYELLKSFGFQLSSEGHWQIINSSPYYEYYMRVFCTEANKPVKEEKKPEPDLVEQKEEIPLDPNQGIEV